MYLCVCVCVHVVVCMINSKYKRELSLHKEWESIDRTFLGWGLHLPILPRFSLPIATSIIQVTGWNWPSQYPHSILVIMAMRKNTAFGKEPSLWPAAGQWRLRHSWFLEVPVMRDPLTPPFPISWMGSLAASHPPKALWRPVPSLSKDHSYYTATSCLF